MENKIIVIGSLIGGFLSPLIGGYDQTIKWLGVVILMNWLTGLTKAFYTKTVNADKVYKGMGRLIAMFGMVAVSVVVSQMIEKDVRVYMVSAFILQQTLSVTENASIFLPIPEKWVEYLDIMKGGEK